jgi:hypothetical protein
MRAFVATMNAWLEAVTVKLQPFPVPNPKSVYEFFLECKVSFHVACVFVIILTLLSAVASSASGSGPSGVRSRQRDEDDADLTPNVRSSKKRRTSDAETTPGTSYKDKEMWRAINKKLLTVSGNVRLPVAYIQAPPDRYSLRPPDLVWVASVSPFIFFVLLSAHLSLQLKEEFVRNSFKSTSFAAPMVINVETKLPRCTLSDITSRPGSNDFSMYVVNGNHTRIAKTELFNETKNDVYKMHSVVLYLNLTDSEALAVGSQAQVTHLFIIRSVKFLIVH